MSEKDTIAIQLVREALLQSCAPGVATEEVLSKVGIDPALLSPMTRACRPVSTRGCGACWLGAAMTSSLAWTRAS